MAPLVDRLIDPPVLLAHRGASATEAPDSPEAHELAARLGADGVLTSAHRSREGGAAVVGGGRRGLRRLPEAPVETVHDTVLRHSLVFAVVVQDAAVATGLVDRARSRGGVEGLWICSEDLDLLVGLRHSTAATRLLHHCVPAEQEGGAERHAARLREVRLDGVLMPEDRVAAGLVALMHRFERIVAAVGADHPRTARRALRHGVDAVAGRDVELLRDALGADAAG
jgi:glycerophosphoryl diester phosphodiesterase